MRILLVLIHNNDQRRLSHIRPGLSSLRARLSQSHTVRLTEVSGQPSICEVSRWTSLRQWLLMAHALYGWRVHVGQPSGIGHWSRLFIKGAWKRLRVLYSDGGDRRRSIGYIEPIVSDKHLRGLGLGLDFGAELTLLFEDDAFFRPESVQRIADWIERLDLPVALPFYGDIAGGVDPKGLGMDLIEARRENGITHYSKMATNTTCGYAVNGAFVSDLQDHLLRNPALRLLPIDWLYNQFMVDWHKMHVGAVCQHLEPPALDHGSFKGQYQSWNS